MEVCRELRMPRSLRGDGCFRHCTNVMLKMFDVTPGQLAPTVLSDVGCLSEVMPTEVLGALHQHAGCLCLSVDLWFDCVEDLWRAEAGMVPNFFALMNQNAAGSSMCWARSDTDLVFACREYQVRGGTVVNSAPRRAHAVVEALHPAVCNPGANCVNVVLSGCVEGATCRFMCRVKGRYYRMDVMQELRLPDGRVSLKLGAPVEDDALGVAWVEVFQTLSNGQVVVSQPYPMLLTTYCDICVELSSLFEGQGTRDAQNLVGILKDLEDLYHPYESSSQLDPEAFAPLLLLCTRNGFHETLAAITDEIAFRGINCPLRTLFTAANRLVVPSDILNLAAMSRCQSTVYSISLLLVEANHEVEGKASVGLSSATTSSSHPSLSELGNSSVSSMNSRVSANCAPVLSAETLSLDERWGARTINYLIHPLSAPTTLLVASLFFSCFPWLNSQVVGHAMFVTVCVHLFLPLMYSFAYERYVDDLQRQASRLGLSFSARELSFGDAEVVKLYNSYAMRHTDSLLRRVVFFAHIIIGTLTFPIFKYSKHGFLGEDWALSAVGAVAHAILCVLRIRASRRGSLLDAQRVNGVVSHMINISLLGFIIQAGLFGTANFALPIYFIEGNNGWTCPWARMLTSYAANVAFFTGIRVTVLPNAWRDVFVQKLLQSIIYFLCGFFAHAIETSRGQMDAPYLWVAWTLADLPIGIATIGLRTRFEAVLLRGFMEELEGKNSKED